MDLEEMGRQFVNVDKLRAKQRKRIDTKASKGVSFVHFSKQIWKGMRFHPFV